MLSADATGTKLDYVRGMTNSYSSRAPLTVGGKTTKSIDWTPSTEPASPPRTCRSRCESCSKTCSAPKMAAWSRAEDVVALASGTPRQSPTRDRLHAEPRPAAGLHRRARGRRPRRHARRDESWAAIPQDQSAPARRAGDRSLGAGRRIRHAPTRCARTPTSSSSATASATRSCAGDRRRSRTSRSFRPTPASSTRSTSNTSPASCSRRSETAKPVAYPDTLVGTDSHTTMVNGLGVLGWGVGGIEAEAAMLGQPVSMLIPQVVGFKLTGELRRRRDRDRPRAHRHADAAQEGRGRQVRRVLRRRACALCRSPIARPSPTWRPNTARPAASSRSTTRRFDTCASPAAPAEQIALVEAYCKEQGLFHTDEDARAATYTDIAGARPRDRRAERRRAQAPAGSRGLLERQEDSFRRQAADRFEARRSADNALAGRWRRSTRSPAVAADRARTARSSSPPSPAAPTHRIRRSCSPPGSSPRKPSNAV